VIASALGDILAADTALTDKLASYNSSPAITTIDPPPEDMGAPLVVLRGPVGGVRMGSRTSEGTIVDYDVTCYGNKGRSTATIRDVAWRIWELMERADLSISGYESVGVTALPPRSAPDPDGFPGWVIMTSVHAIRR